MRRNFTKPKKRKKNLKKRKKNLKKVKKKVIHLTSKT